MRLSLLSLALPVLAWAAPLLGSLDSDIDLDSSKYIVVLKKQSTEAVVTQVAGRISDILGAVGLDATYSFGSFSGFAVRMNDGLASIINALEEVAYIEKDSVMHATTLATQADAPWGLGRISNAGSGSTTYNYDDSAGTGTFSYIIDSGIFVTHPDFGGRATFGINLAGDGNDTDCSGHGTHVAGTTGSTTYGVAKKTDLIAVKVLGCNGSGEVSNIISGIQWAANDTVTNGRVGKAVANMSLGGPFSQAVNDAVAAATGQGLFFAVSAGNSIHDASQDSPASEASACTVAATDINDGFATSFSNFGSAVDVLAPGVNILSTWNDGSTKLLNGTSQSSPHVAGLAAYLLALEGAMDPASLCARIQSLAGKDYIQNDPANTVNYIAFNGAS